ncbi:MAG: Uma2 family endonuclease [Spirulinaceae cyanobacterium]
MVSSPSRTPSTQKSDTQELASTGWRVVIDSEANDGSTIWIPLTPEEFLHPTEDCHLPSSTFHDEVAGHAKDVLTRRYAEDSTVGVFRDLIVEWDTDGGDNCPDVFVAFGIENKEINRSKFIVKNERVRPGLVIEVVSPNYRKEDREIKVVQYATAGVGEYIIVDRRQQRGKILEEVLGYRLVGSHYQPITPDEEGRILCESVGVLMSLHEESLVIEDADSGERLLSSMELEEVNSELEKANSELEAAKQSAEQQAEEMAALLARYQQQFGALPEDNNS